MLFATCCSKTKHFFPSGQHRPPEESLKREKEKVRGEVRGKAGSTCEGRPWGLHLQRPWTPSEAHKIAPRTKETVFPMHRGTEASIFLICSFESLKKNKNGFLSPLTTTKGFIKPTCPVWRKEMTSDCKGVKNSIWAYFSQSCHWLSLSLKRRQEPAFDVCKHWGFSEKNGTNKLKLIVSLRDQQDKGTCVNNVPTTKLHHLLVTVHSWNSSVSGKQLSREPFLPDTGPFIGDLLVNNTK